MDALSLHRQMAQYADWKHQLSTQIEQCQRWFEAHRLGSPNAQHSLAKASQLLANDQFTVACVGEFSRGKTEFINALLFNEYGQRLLPSQPGRTTMCPTEIFFDADNQPGCVRLLPIETRRSHSSLRSFKCIPRHWIRIEFDAHNPSSVRDAMARIAETKEVSVEVARALGFNADDLSRAAEGNGLVEIPTWRHALVNLDHPLLRQGLRVLDTPGLNALGNEPELTLSALAQANAIIFLLAADSGVTSSDYDIWTQHINDLRSTSHVMALLNKLDMLWDELMPAEEVEAGIDRVRETTARQLSLPLEQVLAASAKQGLLAKAANDRLKLRRSQLPLLEQQLAQLIQYNQQRLAERRSIVDAISIMQTTRKQLRQQLFKADRELESLQQGQKNKQNYGELLQRLRVDAKAQHQQCHRRALDLRFHQRRMNEHLQSIQRPIGCESVRALASATQAQVEASWTANSVSDALSNFFIKLDELFMQSEEAADKANRGLQKIYDSLNDKLTAAEAQRHYLHLHPFRRRFEQLQAQVLQFRHSLSGLMGHKNKTASRFIVTLMQEVQNLTEQMMDETESWHREALAPVTHQAQYEKSLLEQQMLQLANLGQQQEDAEQRLRELRGVIAQREEALFALDQVIGAIPIGTAVSGQNLAEQREQQQHRQAPRLSA